MVLLYFQKGFNYSQDGPGNRLIYHLQGCNMKCGWCSNPEGMDLSGKCSVASTDEIVDEVISCRPMFFDGGGVTFTGGEATLQPEALTEIMRRLKAEGVSTAIETNGTHKSLLQILDYCDYLMMDFKHPDSNLHKKYTGMPNNAIKENIIAASQKLTVHIRIPLIHGFNDDEEAVSGFLRFFTALLDNSGKFDVELLSYHEYGKEKWFRLGKEYTVKNGFVSKQFVADFKQRLCDNEIKVIST